MSSKPAMRGFTLIELMVTVALVAILMAVAAPSVATFQRNAQLTSFTNSLVAAINAARGEAMKRGRYAMVVPKDGAHWESGFIAFVDVDRSQTYSTNHDLTATNDITILTKEAAPSYLTIPNPTGSASATPPYIMFDASGYPATKNGSFGGLSFSVVRNDVSSSAAASETRRVIIAPAGRIRTCKPSSATDTTCSASATN